MCEFQAAGEEEFEEPRVAGVNYAESVLTTSYREARPRFAVDDDGVTEILRLPLRVDIGVVAGGIHEEGTVGAEATIEDDQRSIEFVTGG